jgi:hypothetical protein
LGPVPVRISPPLKAILSGWLRGTDCEWAFPGKQRKGPWQERGGRSESGQRTPLHDLDSAARAVRAKGITFESLSRFHAQNIVPIVDLGAAKAPRRPKSATSTDPPLPSIHLGQPGEPVFIDGKEQPPLRHGPHDVVSALLDAGPYGLDECELREKSGRGGWWRMLKALQEDPDWARILVFPGGPWGRYRILAHRVR